MQTRNTTEFRCCTIPEVTTLIIPKNWKVKNKNYTLSLLIFKGGGWELRSKVTGFVHMSRFYLSLRPDLE